MSGARWLLTLLCIAHAGVAWAGEGDTFRPVATYSYGYDSNLLRQDEAYAIATSGSLDSETYNRLGVGFNLDWKQGRQRVLSKVLASKTKFDRYTVLDYDGQDLSLEWQWQLGNYWSGNLGASQTKTLGSFRDLGTLVSNTRTNDNRFFRADYRFHSRWQASFRASTASADYSAAAQRGSNWEADTLGAAVYYQGHTLDRLGVELRNSDGRYPGRTASTTLATRYRERGVDFVANYTATGKSRLNTRIGYIQRDNNNLAGDYTGFEWRLDGTWFPTGKSLVGLSLYRDISNTELSTSNHSVINGASLTWQWQVLPKTRLQASLVREAIDYDGITRKDTITTATLFATYEAWRGGEISLGVQRETRDTNATNGPIVFLTPPFLRTFSLDYTSNSLFLNANLLF